MDRHGSFAKIWKEKVVIPTYEVGKPDRNPMFLEKRCIRQPDQYGLWASAFKKIQA